MSISPTSRDIVLAAYVVASARISYVPLINVIDEEDSS